MIKCPGSQSFSKPHPELITCRFCGKEIEIWSDEIKTKCPHCEKIMFREQEQSCLDWCKYTKVCVGEKVYKKYLENKKTKGGKHVK